MDFQKYANNNRYPLRQDFYEEVEVTVKLKSGEINRFENVFNKDAYLAAINDYRRQAFEIKSMFKKDLFEELGIVGHPKAERLFELAERDSDNPQDIFYEAEELATLLSWAAFAAG